MARFGKSNNQDKHAALTEAFAMAERNTTADKIGNASYGFAKASGMPRSPAQMASAKKAALTSAANRTARAEAAHVLEPKKKKAFSGGFGPPKKNFGL